MDQIVVGKRIPIGAIVGGIMSAAFFFWNAANPETPISAEAATGLTTAAIGIVQLITVNALGVTNPAQRSTK